jgi:NADH:ubiquinone oxidoreductase subunit F (NADH-binding)
MTNRQHSDRVAASGSSALATAHVEEAAAVPASGAPRLLENRSSGPDLPGHLRRHGPLPGLDGPALLDAVERSGLTGRGGAGFPTGRKLRAVAQAAASGRGAMRRRGAVVVANGCEGEPASGKDRVLFLTAPHLVLDGIALAARAVGADRAHLCLHEDAAEQIRSVERALAERRAAGVPDAGVRIATVPNRYVASEETALVRLLGGGPALPQYTPPRPFERGVGGRPTLVNNAETFAHLALIARHGPAWFRSAGTAEAPGTALVTIGGAVAAPGVYEVPLGVDGAQLFAAAGGPSAPLQAVLAGGYFGAWLPADAFRRTRITGPDLERAGAAMGAGIFLALPADRCGLAETAGIARYLAEQSANQCGPCLNGLPALASGLETLAAGTDRRAAKYIKQLSPYVDGRGACRHPDGAVRLIASALAVFSGDAAAHAAGRPCAGARRRPLFPIPARAAELAGRSR